MILLIDNYDSFVHNLARYFQRLGQVTRVVRNDAIAIEQIVELQPQAIVLSPGPCDPHAAGISLQVVSHFYRSIPILGVCLGHQTIGAAFGGKVIRASEPRHGRTSLVYHDGSRLFASLPSPFTAGRYHSLVVDRHCWPAALQCTAWTSDGLAMALEHRDYPVFGVQFHPESILTEGGFQLLENFLQLIGAAKQQAAPTNHSNVATNSNMAASPSAAAADAFAQELVLPTVVEPLAPIRPITF
ncbi:MAG: anthranilate synthase component II [Planctomycetota bacterium]